MGYKKRDVGFFSTCEFIQIYGKENQNILRTSFSLIVEFQSQISNGKWKLTFNSAIFIIFTNNSRLSIRKPYNLFIFTDNFKSGQLVLPFENLFILLIRICTWLKITWNMTTIKQKCYSLLLGREYLHFLDGLNWLQMKKVQCCF